MAAGRAAAERAALAIGVVVTDPQIDGFGQSQNGRGCEIWGFLFEGEADGILGRALRR